MAQGRSTEVISMMKWIRNSRLSMKNALSLRHLLSAILLEGRSAVSNSFRWTECLQQFALMNGMLSAICFDGQSAVSNSF
jgi:hypothetical protein